MDPFDEFENYFNRRVRQMFNAPDSWTRPTFASIEPASGSQALASSSDSRHPTASSSFLSTRLELVENPSSYKVNVELPGVRKEDIKVNIEGGVVTIEAERNYSAERDNERCHYSERRYGKVKRQVALPPTADTKKVNASFENGMLHIEFAKGGETEKRQAINIK